MAKKKRVSQTQQAYRKELNRIKNFIRRAEKRGFLFPDNIIPQQPKTITKASVRRLQRFNPDYLYKKSRYIDVETGEILKGEAGRAYERSQVAKRAAETRRQKKAAEAAFFSSEPATLAILGKIRTSNFLEMLMERLGEPISPTWETFNGVKRPKRAEVYAMAEAGRKRILDLVNQRIDELGYETFGNTINPYADQLNDLLDVLRFSSSDGNAVQNAITELVQIIMARPLTLEELTDINNFEEYDDDYNIE